MKKFLLALVLTIFSISAFALDKCFEGNWYDPTIDNGEGIDIEVLEDRNLALAHFYTWDGTRRDTYVFLGENDIEGAWVFKAYQSVVLNGVISSRYVGNGSVTEVDVNTIRFEYDFAFNYIRYENPDVVIPWCVGCSRDIVYKRLTQPHPCD